MSYGIESTLEELLALRDDAKHLSFSARRMSLSQLAGRYASHFRGRGMDYHESRLYANGDDIRNIDWRVSARTGKLHSKVFIEERERPVLIVADFSPSMYFATRGAFKSVVAARLAALLAWYAGERGDRVGGLLFTPAGHPPTEQDIRPGSGRKPVLQILRALAEATRLHAHTSGENRLIDAVEHTRRVARPGSLVLLISDFSCVRTPSRQAAFQQALHPLSAHSDVMAFMISDPIERALPENRAVPLSNGRQRFRVGRADRNSRQRLQRDYVSRHAWLVTEFGRLGQPVVPVSTQDRLLDILNRPAHALKHA